MAWLIAITLLAAGLTDPRDDPKPAESTPKAPAPSEFKVIFEYFGVGKEPIASGEMVAGRGRLYRFLQHSSEVTILDPSKGAIVLLDLERKATTEIPLADLESKLAGSAAAWRRSIADSEKKEARADRIAARMQRDLIEPRFKAAYNEATHTAMLKNETVEVDAVGVPDADPARVALVAEGIAVASKLHTIRADDDLPPYSELEATAALARGHDLRPAEMTFLFRLAGPPKRFRWTYRLVPTITDRERDALGRIDDLIPKVRKYDLDRYDRLIAAEERN